MRRGVRRYAPMQMRSGPVWVSLLRAPQSGGSVYECHPLTFGELFYEGEVNHGRGVSEAERGPSRGDFVWRLEGGGTRDYLVYSGGVERVLGLASGVVARGTCLTG